MSETNSTVSAEPWGPHQLPGVLARFARHGDELVDLLGELTGVRRFIYIAEVGENVGEMLIRDRDFTDDERAQLDAFYARLAADKGPDV